jgi:hypothetical protein
LSVRGFGVGVWGVGVGGEFPGKNGEFELGDQGGIGAGVILKEVVVSEVGRASDGYGGEESREY